MPIVFPNAAVARRWGAERQTRACRAPLEEFLRARAMAPAPAGVARDSDNLARATTVIVEAGIVAFCSRHTAELDAPQRTMVGHLACIVSRALAQSISQPAGWRIAALLSTARLLSPWIGLNAAALAATTCVRHFERNSLGGAPVPDACISLAAAAAVGGDSAKALTEIAEIMAMRLNCSSAEFFSPMGNLAAPKQFLSSS